MESKLKSALEAPLKEIGVSISDITLGEEDGVKTLFIKIDSDDVVDTDLCAKASEIINPIIDDLEIEELNDNFVLDICSKGEDDEQ